VGDVLGEIEDAHAQHDIGVTAFRIYGGARESGASRLDACSIVYAWFLAMLDQGKNEKDDE